MYGHNYYALYTIFTCKLKVEDVESLEVAWRTRKAIARQHGLVGVHIHGFIVDNAEAGWIVVRNIFFGRHPDLKRERSNAFHFYQSFH